MPTYVYRRPDGTTFEVFQKISAPALTEDPDTGVPVHRVISGGAGLQFKGDGFYLTDYVRKDKGSDEKTSEPSSKSESASKESTSSKDSPSESKSKPKPATSSSTTSDD